MFFYMFNTSSRGLIAAIVFCSLMVSGSLIFLGSQISSNNQASILDSDLEDLKKLIAKDNGSAPSAPKAGPVVPVDPDKDHIRGNLDAEISVIEYSDFECGFCKKVHPTLQQVVENYDGKVNWVYRHFPLSFHDPLATKEAIASECAAEQGGNDAFWSYTDLIFATTTSNGNGLQEDQLPQMAAQIGLNQKEFEKCLGSGKYDQHIQQEMSEGSQAGVSGTPGNIVINNRTKESRLVSGAQPFASFTSTIDELLSE
jgi:protein-disulfide isomerase